MEASPPDADLTIYTIGHSNHPLETFLGLLRQHGIRALFDVRSSPYSGYTPYFNKDEIPRALETFPGVRRRLEFKGERDGTRIYDDYAHHPTEVAAALSALRGLGPERLIAVFQPHLYSRTKVFSQAFGEALATADEIIVLDVYPAREQPIGRFEGVSGMDVVRAAADSSDGRAVWWAPDADSAERVALGRLGSDRILVTVGAGDITKLSDRLAQTEVPGSGQG